MRKWVEAQMGKSSKRDEPEAGGYAGEAGRGNEETISEKAKVKSMKGKLDYWNDGKEGKGKSVNAQMRKCVKARSQKLEAGRVNGKTRSYGKDGLLE